MGEALAALRDALSGTARRAAYVQFTEIEKMDRGWGSADALKGLAGRGLCLRHWPQTVSVNDFEENG
jgi:hypothetical protein